MNGATNNPNPHNGVNIMMTITAFSNNIPSLISSLHGSGLHSDLSPARAGNDTLSIPVTDLDRFHLILSNLRRLGVRYDLNGEL